MPTYNRAKAITKYINLSIQEKWDFSTLRKRMKNEFNNLDEEEFSFLLNFVDDKRQTYDVIKSDKLIGISAIIGGVTLIAIGVIVSLGTYLEWFGTSPIFIILYGPIIAGVSALGYGYSKKNNYDNFIAANQVEL